MGEEFKQIAAIHPNVKDKDLKFFNNGSNEAMFRGGAHFSDAISFGGLDINEELILDLAKEKGKNVLMYNEESDLTDYLELYNDLAAV